MSQKIEKMKGMLKRSQGMLKRSQGMEDYMLDIEGLFQFPNIQLPQSSIYRRWILLIELEILRII